MRKERAWKIHSKDFSVREGDDVDLRKWPTIVDPVYQSKEQYQELLDPLQQTQINLGCAVTAGAHGKLHAIQILDRRKASKTLLPLLRA